MGEKSVADRLAALKKQAEKAEAEKLKLEKMAQEARKEAESLIPQLKEQMLSIDTQITGLQGEKKVIMEQLALLGEKVSAKGAGKGARAGGMKDKLKELIRQVGPGGKITNDDIEDYLGSKSGYVGMMITEMLDGGFIKRTDPGKYEVTGVP